MKTMKKIPSSVLCALVAFLVGAHSVSALSLSVTPTLVDMAAVPGQSWSTNVKVINNNPTPLTVYAETRNFSPQGEFGAGMFLPVYEEMTDGTTLAEWMKVSSDPIVVQPEQTVSIPVQITVPTDADPGGHYAAVMIGTRPPATEGRYSVQTSQVISALFFLRVAGDVHEQGTIRSFASGSNVATDPAMDFSLRFENQGNVHLRPQGEITISNMWGKERGVIPINQKTHFGNVLPESIREFTFSWQAEDRFVDIGRYKAEVTLGYGEEVRQFVTRTDYFWIIPMKPLLVTLAVVVSIIGVVTFFVRMYIRRMLALSGVTPGGVSQPGAYVPRHQRIQAGDVQVVHRNHIAAPVRAGWVDFSTRFESMSSLRQFFATWLQFIKDYRLFFIAIVSFLLLSSIVWRFFVIVFTDQATYEVTIGNPEAETVISSEEIYAERTGVVTNDQTTSGQGYRLEVVNEGGEPGAAARVAGLLRGGGYAVSDIRAELDVSRDQSVIVFSESLQTQALAISKLLGGVLVSANNQASEPVITIYIGDTLSLPLEE